MVKLMTLIQFDSQKSYSHKRTNGHNGCDIPFSALFMWKIYFLDVLSIIKLIIIHPYLVDRVVTSHPWVESQVKSGQNSQVTG